MISVKEVAKLCHCLAKLRCFGKHYDAEMIGLGPVKAAAGNYKDICCAEKISCKFLVICYTEFLYVQLGEQIESGFVFDVRNSVDSVKHLGGSFALLKVASAGTNHGSGGFHIIKGSGDYKLSQCV